MSEVLEENDGLRTNMALLKGLISALFQCSADRSKIEGASANAFFDASPRIELPFHTWQSSVKREQRVL